MNNRTNIRKAALLGCCAACLVCGGCAVPARAPAQETPRRLGGAAAGQPVTSAELDELTRAFADRYVGLLYSVCDELKKDNPDPVQRREAQVLLLDCSTNVYDIASNADAFTRVLDLVVVTSLVSQVWIDDGRAKAVFGERGEGLARAMLHAREESRALAARVLTAEQLEVLDSLLSDWRAENPEMVSASFVRFSNFAIGRGRSAVSEVLAARGQFAEIGRTGQAVDEARLLGERMFYRLKREPTLLRWQATAMKDDLFATPQIATALADMGRLTDQIEQLPANLAAERQAIVEDIDISLERADATIASLRGAMNEANTFIAALQPASESLGATLATVDGLIARYQEAARWRLENNIRPFDIREFTETAREVAVAADQLNQALAASDHLLGSSEWSSRIEEVTVAADGRITMAADQSQVVMNAFFWRACLLLGALFAMLIVYRLISILLLRRLDRPRLDNDHAVHFAASNANGRAALSRSSKGS